jgi:hypothetical protein
MHFHFWLTYTITWRRPSSSSVSGARFTTVKLGFLVPPGNTPRRIFHFRDLQWLSFVLLLMLIIVLQFYVFFVHLLVIHSLTQGIWKDTCKRVDSTHFLQTVCRWRGCWGVGANDPESPGSRHRVDPCRTHGGGQRWGTKHWKVSDNPITPSYAMLHVYMREVKMCQYSIMFCF